MQTLEGGVHLMDTATPRIVVTVMQANKVGQVTALPDTGSTVNAMSTTPASRTT